MGSNNHDDGHGSNYGFSGSNSSSKEGGRHHHHDHYKSDDDAEADHRCGNNDKDGFNYRYDDDDKESIIDIMLREVTLTGSRMGQAVIR